MKAGYKIIVNGVYSSITKCLSVHNYSHSNEIVMLGWYDYEAAKTGAYFEVVGFWKIKNLKQ